LIDLIKKRKPGQNLEQPFKDVKVTKKHPKKKKKKSRSYSKRRKPTQPSRPRITPQQFRFY